MPILDLYNFYEGEGLSRNAPICVLGRMHYPADDEQYDQFVVVTLKKAELEVESTDPLDPALYRALDPNKYLHNEKRHDRGTTAGAVLIILRTIFERYQEYEPSLNKAFAVLEADLQGSGRPWDRRRPPANVRDIQKAWKAFKSVSHLWAAALLLRQQAGITDAEETFSAPETLPLFLAVAEDMRQFAQTYSQPRARKALLNPGEAWQVPRDLSLPIIKLDMPPLAREALEVLKNYRAPTD